MNILVSGLFSAADSYGKGTATMEIIIMLLVAFILGYLLRYFLSDNQHDEVDYEAKYTSLIEDLKLQFKACCKERDELKSVANKQQLGIAGAVAKKEPVKKDKLQKIEGIGPKIEQLLYAAGIYTWDDLSKTEVSAIQVVLDNAGPRYKMHNPESWPFQAKLAAEGKWDELNKWQDEHKGGRF